MKIYFAKDASLGVFENGAFTIHESAYFRRYTGNLEQIIRKNEWKNSGSGAAFQGKRLDYRAFQSQFKPQCWINGISVCGKDEIVYSLTIDNLSAILTRKMNDAESSEGHLLHDDERHFYNVAYRPDLSGGMFSVQTSGLERNLAVFDGLESHYREITEGDSIDENPCWGSSDFKIIYYNSVPIARDGGGNFHSLGSSVINRMDLSTGEITEIAAFKDFDCILPKTDFKNNIYFIRKPHIKRRKERDLFGVFKDLFLFPFRILNALFSFINLFTISYTGTPLVKSGETGVKTEKSDDNTLFVNGNIINAAKNLKENEAKKISFPGIAPYSWELMRIDVSGKAECIRKAVLDYDVDNEGNVIFSNGKYVVRLDKSGKEEVLFKMDLVSKVVIDKI